MFKQAKAHDSRYADFASRMLAATAQEEASIASHNAQFQAPTQAQTLETVRPTKG